MKTKKIVKEAIKHPDQWSWADLTFFGKWLEEKKKQKEEKKKKNQK